MGLKVIGVDIAKNVFQITGMDKAGKVLLRERINRKNLAVYISKLPKCLIGMETCCSMNYWARKFRDMGHEVKVMNSKYVKPYVKQIRMMLMILKQYGSCNKAYNEVCTN